MNIKSSLTNLATPEQVLAFLNSFWKACGIDAPGEARRAVIYVRKSRLLADEPHYSDVVQEKRCREYAQNQGWDVADVIVDLDESGKNAKRPGF